MEKHDKLIIFCDGGARGNPGPAAYGFVVYDEEKNKIYEEGKVLGIQTNNFAEYTAVISALKWILKNTQKKMPIEFYLDSMLVVNQLNGIYKIKSETIRELYSAAEKLLREIPGAVSFTAVPRSQNSAADRMVNLALDQKI